MDVVVFHSMYGLRPMESAAAERIRELGHHVVVPDLFDGQVAEAEVEAGFALMDRIGWPTIVARAADSLSRVSDDAALIGFSMGVGVIGQLWPDRLGAVAVGCLCAPVAVPPGVRRGVPVQLHVSAGDSRFAPVEQVDRFRRSAADAGANALVRTYPHTGHLFLDESLTDYDADAAATTWIDLRQVLTSLG